MVVHAEHDPLLGKLSARTQGAGQDLSLLIRGQVIDHQNTRDMDLELPHREIPNHDAYGNLNLDDHGDLPRFPIVHEGFLEAGPKLALSLEDDLDHGDIVMDLMECRDLT